MSTIFETTDALASRLTPYALHLGEEFRGKLNAGGSDWLAVTLTAGSTYTFGAVGLGALHSGVGNTQLVLHAANGSIISSDDDGGPGKSSSLTFTAATGGTYYIEVQSKAGPVDGAYGLSMAQGSRASYGVELGAAELYRPGQSWASAPAKAVTVTYGFRDTDPGATDASDQSAPFHHLTTAQMAAASYALANYAAVANISFQQVKTNGQFTDGATILIGAYTSNSDGAGAFAYYPGVGAQAKLAGSDAGDLWINTTSVNASQLSIGSYSQYVFLHELGHAVGLAHPSDYNAGQGGSITYANAAQFAQDSAQYSVMSYFDAADTQAFAPQHYPDTLMMYDICAVQQLYGVNLTTNAGNSVYGFNSTVGGAFNFAVNRAPLLCIWDGGGIDTLDVSGFAQSQRIDLMAGHFSDVGGYKGNVSIALRCRIENAVGGEGADSLTGNIFNNAMAGHGGNDTLAGGAGNDRLTGDAGADHFVFSAGTGRDVVTDFDLAADWLDLSATLWGGVSKTAAEVVAQFGVIVAGHVVLDFGADEISLASLTSMVGLCAHMVVV